MEIDSNLKGSFYLEININFDRNVNVFIPSICLVYYDDKFDSNIKMLELDEQNLYDKTNKAYISMGMYEQISSKIQKIVKKHNLQLYDMSNEQASYILQKNISLENVLNIMQELFQVYINAVSDKSYKHIQDINNFFED